MRTVLDEIDARVAAARSRAEDQGAALRPPVLALGVSERVGSNWLSDLLRAVMVQHNEPMRQQIGPEHPLSALNPCLTGIAGAQLDGLTRHWLVTFAVSKYATSERHLVKETNLFFALPALLRLFPQAPVVVLTRGPVGVVSSFMRGGLWARWSYARRYQVLATLTQRKEFSPWAALVPRDDPDDVTALSRLVVLNAVLLAQHLADREHTVLSYEQHVLAPQATRQHVAAVLPEVLKSAPAVSAEPVNANDGTFATAGTKEELVAMLSSSQAGKVRNETALRLHHAADLAGDEAVCAARMWLAGDHLYQLSNQPLIRSTSRLPRPRGRPTSLRYVPAAGVEIRNLLVSNEEYARMLNLLAAAGVPNSYSGTHLLLTPIPHGRGGVNGQVVVPAGGQVKVPTPGVDYFLLGVVPPFALASRMR